jgi:hypothetical protein
MSAITDVQPAVSSVEIEKSGPLAALLDVVFEPSRVFRSVMESGAWLAPFLIAIVLTAAVSGVLMKKLDYERSVRDQYASYHQQPSEQEVAHAVEMQQKMRPLLPLFGIFGYCFAFFGAVLMLAIGAQMAGSTEGFRKVLSIHAYAQVPTIVATGAVLAVAALRDNASMTFVEAQSLIKSNVGAFLSPDAAAPLKTLCSSLDVFSIATVILLSFGFRQLPGLSRRTGAVLPVAMWAGYVLLKCGWALIIH